MKTTKPTKTTAPKNAAKKSAKPSKATVVANAETARMNAEQDALPHVIHDEPMEHPEPPFPTPAEIAAQVKADVQAKRKADRDAKNAARKADREAKIAARRAERERLRAQLNPRDVYVSDREYFLAKGALPFGHARWEFAVDPRHAKRDTDAFTYTGKFGPAKAAAKKHFAALDINSVEVVVPAAIAEASTTDDQPTA